MSSRTDVLARALPRVRHVPRAVDSDADDAVFLASSYGLTPDPWQEDVLESWLGRRRDGRWAAATCGLAVPRQNGKNAVIEIRELYGMVALGEKFLHTAHQVKTARKAFLRITSFFENERQYPELAAMVKEIRRTNGQEAVVLKNGGSVEFVARSRNSGRGFTVDHLVLDEAQDLTDDELAALLPTISAAPLANPQVTIVGTPPDAERGETGEVFTRVRADGEEGRDPRLSWTDFGLADGPLSGVDLDDRLLWAEKNPALGHRLNIGEVERERRLMSDEKFAAERLGWFGDPDLAARVNVFGDKWAACEVDSFDFLPVGAIGIAVSIDRTHGSIGAADKRGDVMHIGGVERREGLRWMIAEARRIQKETGCLVVVDAKGPAAGLIDDLQSASVSVTEASLNDYLDGCAELFDAVQAGEVAYMRGDEELKAAVTGARKREIGDRWAWGRKASTSDVSMLETVTLAAWAVNYWQGGVILG